MAIMEDPAIGYLVSWISRAQPTGKTTHMAESTRTGSGLNALGERRPADRRFRGDVLVSFIFKEVDEMNESNTRFRKPRAELTAKRQVLGQSIV
jgi:hypothetical protein